MENPSQRRARLIVDVNEHGTVVGTNDPVNLEFEDCVMAVNGLIDWLARALAETNEESSEEIGSAILIDALHHWTFDERIDASDDSETPSEEEPGMSDN